MESTEKSTENTEILEVSTESTEESLESFQTSEIQDEDFYTIEDAIALSGISKSLFYQRKSALGIESIRQGKQTCVKGFQLKAIRDYSNLATVAKSEMTGQQTTKVTGVTGINPNKIKQRATSIAKEMVIAELLGEQLAANPELLSEEDRLEINLYRSHFEESFPKKKYSPEDLTNLVIPNHKQPQEENAEEYLEVC